MSPGPLQHARALLALVLLPLLLAAGRGPAEAPPAHAVTAEAQSGPGAQPKLFQGYCAMCHMPDARGVPDLYPPLDRVGYYLQVREGRAYLPRVVLFGLLGRITVNGRPYGGGAQYMPAFASLLDDATLAELLNELIAHFNTETAGPGFTPYTALELARYREPLATANQMFAERERVIDELRRRGLAAP